MAAPPPDSQQRYVYVLLRKETTALNPALSENRIHVLYVFHKEEDALKTFRALSQSFFDERSKLNPTNTWPHPIVFAYEHGEKFQWYELWEQKGSQPMRSLGRFWIEKIPLLG
jgi:hypothetical protein